jgi:hypothetical protein
MCDYCGCGSVTPDMLSSLQLLSLIDPPLPQTLPEACLLCCFTMKINKQFLQSIHKRHAARVSAAKVSFPFSHTLAPLAPRISSLSGSSARCSSIPPRSHCTSLLFPSNLSAASTDESASASAPPNLSSKFEPRPQVTWDELSAVMTHGVVLQPADLPQSPDRATPANNLHTMVRAPHNNPTKDKQRSKWMSYASQNAAALLPSLSLQLDEERALELKPLSPSFFRQPDSDPNNVGHILNLCSPLPPTERVPTSPSKSPTSSSNSSSASPIEVTSLSRVLFCDALPPIVLQAARPLFSSSLGGASVPEFIACIGAALQKSHTPTRFYFIVYFHANAVHAVENAASSLGRVAAIACYWITTSFDMARYMRVHVMSLSS